MRLACFHRLDLCQPLGAVNAGDRFFVTKNHSSVYAFRIGRKPLAEAGDAKELKIEQYDDVWVVSGPWIMKLMNDINFDDYESRMYFDRQLRKSGLFERLEEMGIQDGDTVSIFDFEFEYTK